MLRRLLSDRKRILALAPAYTGAPDQVTSIFNPLSAPAEASHRVALLTLAVCLAIFITVTALLIYAIVRFRRRRGDDDSEPPQIYGSNQIELAWTVLPILIVVVLILVTARTIADVENHPRPPDALKVTIIGRQWWWDIRYPDLGIVTANELHVPTSESGKRRPTFLTLESADVAHSFWVPQLAGKTDLIPNRVNRMWIEPNQAGTYLGNCAEYCGTQHAKMRIRVIAHPPEEFARWVESQRGPAAEATTASAGRERFFSTSCVNCHAIQGTSAQGTFGPDLTHLMSRQTLGSGAAPNNPETLRRWTRNPQAIKEGCLMPDMRLSDQDLDQIVAYLLTLK